MVLICSHCGKEIQGEDSIYCPYCSKQLKNASFRKTGFPMAGGILAIIAACMCIAWGIIGIGAFLSSVGYYDYYYYRTPPVGLFMLEGMLGLLAFAFGLAGGILSLRRRNFALPMLGACLIMASGFVTVLTFGFAGYGSTGWIIGLMFGMPTIVISILSLIFVGISRAEFSQPC